MKRHFSPGKVAVGALIYFLAFAGMRSMAAVGDLYEADFGTGSVFKFTPAGTKTTFATGLGHPAGLAFDPKGNLFVSDSQNGVLYKITPARVTTGFLAGFLRPFGLAFDSNGNLFEADSGTGTILKITPTSMVTVFARGLAAPAGLAFDAANNLYETDFNSGKIFRFTPSLAKTPLVTALHNPDGLHSDRLGNLLEADSNSGTIFSVAPNGVKTTFATGFTQPTGITVDAAGSVFVSDNARGTITKIGAGGARTTFASGLSNPQYLAIERPTGILGNLSTRLFVGTGNDVLIAGFTVTGTASKTVLIRGIGPSLSRFGITSPLPDPVLVLHKGATVVGANNDWQTASNAGQIPVTLRPTDPRESAILVSLAPGSYTATEAGNANGTGVALVEVYDLSTTAMAELTNLSSRGFVQTGNNVMIGGFTNSLGNGSTEVVVRAIGPSLRQFGITNPLPNPTLKLFDANGQLRAFNDDWRTTQQAAIQASGLAPQSDLESVIRITLPNAPHTAIVADKAGATGVALVEVYKIR